MESRVGSVWVCFAVKEEASPFRALVESAPHVEILLTGIGRRNAERTLRTALQRGTPTRVFSCGFAGGLDPRLLLGDVLFAADGDLAMSEQLIKAGARPARFHCADRIAATAAEKRQLRQSTGADAVEMESAPLQTIGRERGIPCAVVRVISDAADRDLPLDFNAVMTPGAELSYLKLASVLARSPTKVASLVTFQKETAYAARRLAEVLRAVV